MTVDLTEAFVGDLHKVISHRVDMSDLDFTGVKAIQKPVEVEVVLDSHASVVTLKLTVDYTFSSFCDRCAVPVERDYHFDLERTLVREYNGDDFDDDRFILVEDNTLDIDDLVISETVLDLPSKFLCKPDCKGLCPKCGKNLNDGRCDCESDDVDPRLEALKGFFN